jgi:hypothetical protein
VTKQVKRVESSARWCGFNPTPPSLIAGSDMIKRAEGVGAVNDHTPPLINP